MLPPAPLSGLSTIDLRQGEHARSDVTRRRFGSTLGWIILALGLVVLGAGSILMLETELYDEAFGLAAAAALFSLGWVFVVAYRQRGNALHPVAISCFYLALHFPFHGLVMRGQMPQLDGLGASADAWLTYGLLLVAFVYPALWVGHESGLATRIVRRLPRLGTAIDDGATATATKVAVIYSIGMLARVVSVALGFAFHFQGSLSEGAQLLEIQFLIHTLAGLPLVMTVYVIATGVRSRPDGKTNWRRIQFGLLMLLGEVVWGALSASRAKMASPIFAALVLLSELWRPMRMRTLVLLAAVFIFIVAPFLTSYRSAYFDQLDAIEREGVKSSTLIDSLTSAAEDDSSTDALEAIATRTHGLTSLALILAYTPEFQDWTLGEPYALLPLQILVPRAIWPTKPDVAPFMDTFRTKYWGLDRGDPTSVATTQIGELYVNLHVFGCLLGTFIFGVLLRFMREVRYGAGPTSVFPIVAFSILVVQIVPATEGPLVGTLATIPKTMLVYLAVSWLLGSRERRATTKGP